MEGCRRPNRSDVHLSEEEKAKMEEQTREYFDGLAPKRHTKPQRSDYSSRYIDAHQNEVIPELAELERLENHSQKMVYNKSEVTEEFVETDYYKDLNCIDKQHHTTGTGFIMVEKANGMGFSLAPHSETACHPACKGNPATNDWIPAAADVESSASDKPNRSDC